MSDYHIQRWGCERPRTTQTTPTPNSTPDGPGHNQSTNHQSKHNSNPSTTSQMTPPATPPSAAQEETAQLTAPQPPAVIPSTSFPPSIMTTATPFPNAWPNHYMGNTHSWPPAPWLGQPGIRTPPYQQLYPTQWYTSSAPNMQPPPQAMW